MSNTQTVMYASKSGSLINITKALKSLSAAIGYIATMGLSATAEGETFWQANLELMVDVEISLQAQLKETIAHNLTTK